jgi:hypothetical protein
MAIDADQILNEIMGAAQDAFKDGWEAVRQYAPGEFRKMAVQLEEIAANVAKFKINPDEGYSPETGQVLFGMQRRACEGVLVAMSKLTLIAVQEALDSIFKVLSNAFGGAFAGFL